MDILFIYPPLSVSARYGRRRLGKVGGHLPPLGVVYIAGFLREAGFDAGIIDGPVEDLSDKEILEKIALLKPRVVGFSAITPVFYRAAELSAKIRERFPDVLIIIGGHHASILLQEVLRENESFDLLVHGEGEGTCRELLERYKDHGFDRESFLSRFALLSRINGIAFRRQEEIIVTPARKPIEDLDKLPPPAWDLLPMDKYIPLPNQYLNKPVIHMVAIRGCPFQCSFCSNNAVFGRKIRAISPKRLVGILKDAKARFGIREVSFWDDCMTTDKKWLREFCRLMREEEMGLSWTCYSRVDTVDKEMLVEMKRAGCWNIFYGFESGNQELLDAIDKKITLEHIREVNQWTKEAGIEVRASFMLALPQETPAMAEKTIDFAIALDPDYVQFCITTPFPKTRLFDDCKKYGILLNDFSQFNIWEPVFIPHGYRDRKQIEEISKKAFRRFYFRPKYIYGRLKKIKSPSDISRYIKGLKMAIGFVR